MTKRKEISVALVGNPNVGKSSVFNQLTGLRQKVGNFPGVTVDKKVGYCKLTEDFEAKITDFPGTYSLYPTSLDEKVVLNVFSNPKDKNYPEVIVYVADVTNLDRHLLLLSQLQDTGLPIVLALTMIDMADKDQVFCNEQLLSEKLGIPVLKINGRTGEGLEGLKNAVVESSTKVNGKTASPIIFKNSPTAEKVSSAIQDRLQLDNQYRALLLAHHHQDLPFLSSEEKNTIQEICQQHDFKAIKLQIDETMQRYDSMAPILQKALKKAPLPAVTNTDKIDRIVTHPVMGPILFFGILIFVFQAIFSWSELPMEWIEESFTATGDLVKAILPEAWYTSLITDGIIAGLGGVLVFIPQIAILFLLIGLLEEVGYMARAVFLFDKIMQKFGLNGRSIVALISGGACAIPAVMSTRTIGNWKERLITIMVTPLISCSARIPVYAILVAFAVPPVTVWGIFNLQAITFIGMYILGAAAALISAYVFKKILKTNESTFLMLELPAYRAPHWKNVLLNVREKVESFVLEAGKVIIIVSIVLWALASYGPGNEMDNAEKEAVKIAQQEQLDETHTADLIASKRIEVSYAGYLGKTIEPAIRPLGFNWKIGIALISSFAAREVFVGTMATIYSIGSADDEGTIKTRMEKEIDPVTGEKVFNPATAFSLLIFYVFAMQCMSTVAIVKRETKSWKWPLIQMGYMGALAYIGSFIVYQIMQ
ncbi:ferrous iron transport protein B [Limibacter armeniacum]|uniref:ferrous iron transport protein B n=1 Tax=Limibacter armeniacum TaxID=466084 RepID=UPI002FE6465E